MAFTLTTKTEVQQSFGTDLYRKAEPYFKAMVEGSFFTDDVRITSGKIHITKVSKSNFDKLRPLLQKNKQKIETKGGKLTCDVPLGKYTIRFLETGKKSVTSGDAQSTAKQERATLWVIKKVLQENKVYRTPGDITKNKKETKELLEIYPEVLDTGWLDHLFAQQKKMVQIYKGKKFDVYNRDAGFMDWISAIIKTKFGISKKDSWNPADIWLIKDEEKVKQEIRDAVAGRAPSLEKLNDLMIQQFKEHRLVGVSLKMPSTKEAKWQLVNMGAKTDKPLDYKLTNIKMTMTINNQNELDTTDTIIKVSAGPNTEASFQIRQNSKGFNNLKFEPTMKGAGAARLGKTPLDLLKAMMTGDFKIPLTKFVNDWNEHPKTVTEFNEQQKDYEDKFKLVNRHKMVTTGIQDGHFVKNIKASFGTTDWQSGYTTSKLMQLNFVNAILELSDKDMNTLLTNMLYLAMKKGPQFGAHGKLY